MKEAGRQLFRNRRDAGRILAANLTVYAGRPDTVVLAVPRGGVPVAFEVAEVLRAPLDVFLVRKLGYPGQEELAMGAIASGGVRVFNADVVERLEVPSEVIEEVTQTEQQELERREKAYRGDRPLPVLRDRVVFLIDDGLATGATVRAAAKAIRHLHPRQLIIAVPVGSADTCEELRSVADTVVCAYCPEPFRAVGCWYADFAQTSDEEVRDLLARSARDFSASPDRTAHLPGSME